MAAVHGMQWNRGASETLSRASPAAPEHRRWESLKYHDLLAWLVRLTHYLHPFDGMR